jgi:hypothetical protein
MKARRLVIGDDRVGLIGGIQHQVDMMDRGGCDDNADVSRDDRISKRDLTPTPPVLQIKS